MSDEQLVTEQGCAALAKIELHIHVESAMELSCFAGLLRQYDVGLELSDQEIGTRLSCATSIGQKGRLQHFLETWRWKNSSIRKIEDYERIGASAARAQADDGICYTEFFFSPMHARSLNLPLAEVVAALSRGFASEPQLRIKLIADLTRDYGEHVCRSVVQELAQIKDPLLVGIGLGGSEHQFPAKHFRSVFADARAAGFHCTAHAGEMAGAASVKDAVHILGVERIGHATRVLEDNTLLTYLVEREIAIEACPYSNLCTGVIQNLEDYPLRALLDAGIKVSVNTDDPLLFGRRLSAELFAVAGAFHLSHDDLILMRDHALDMAWLDHDERADIMSLVAS